MMDKTRLGGVVAINPDSVTQDFPHREIEYIEISSVGSGTLDGTRTIAIEEAPSRAKRLVQDGDTILSTVRPNRRSFLFIKSPLPNTVVSTGFAVLRPSERIDKRFLYYVVNHQPFTDYLTARAKGAAYPAVDTDIIADAEIPLPLLPVQRKIAGILSAYDDLIENNTRRIKILEEMAQRIYREWFVHFRYAGHENDKLVDSGTELGMIPEGWEVVQVESLVKRVRPGKLYAQKTALPSGKVPILDQGRSGIIGYHNDEPGVVASPEQPIIVFANHTCYQRLILHPFSAIQNVLPFLPNDANHRNIYWLHWATKDVIEFNDYKGHWPEFMNKRLALPPPTTCDLFGDVVRPIVGTVYNIEQKNNNLRQTRDLLLPKLISGELDVSGLDIETGDIDDR